MNLLLGVSGSFFSDLGVEGLGIPILIGEESNPKAVRFSEDFEGEVKMGLCRKVSVLDRDRLWDGIVGFFILDILGESGMFSLSWHCNTQCLWDANIGSSINSCFW